MKKKQHNKKGFTLIELMITISVVTVLSILGAPALSEFMEKNKIKTAATSMNSGIQLARSEAIKRNSTVSFNLTNSQWNVTTPDDELVAMAQSEVASTIIQDTLPTGASSLTFDNVGMLTIGPDGLANISRIILTSQKTDYTLWIMLTNSGGSRICDPNETTLNSSIIGCV